ncbi:TPA: hypothetical protein ACIBIG_003699, partial [Salmonella enterica subsp. enterica serovar Waycross]
MLTPEENILRLPITYPHTSSGQLIYIQKATYCDFYPLLQRDKTNLNLNENIHNGILLRKKK